MTEPLDLEAIRRKHQPTMMYGDGRHPVCSVERTAFPCDARRLLDEVERLRAFETKIMGMLGLPTDDELINGSGPEPLGILSHPPRDSWERKGPAQ